MATVQPAPTSPVDAVANLRRSTFLSIGLGIASIIVLAFFGLTLLLPQLADRMTRPLVASRTERGENRDRLAATNARTAAGSVRA